MENIQTRITMIGLACIPFGTVSKSKIEGEAIRWSKAEQYHTPQNKEQCMQNDSTSQLRKEVMQMTGAQGDGKTPSSLPLAVKKRLRGRPVIIRKEGENILSNGWFERQWQWIQREAALIPMDAAVYQRIVMDWWIDSIEASRTGAVVTPEQDQAFEKLVRGAKNSNTRKKHKLRRKK